MHSLPDSRADGSADAHHRGSSFIWSPEYSRYSFADLWPVLFIVSGIVLTAQSLASKDGHAGS